MSIDTSTAFIFDGWLEQPSGCTVLCEVPLVPSNSYYKAEMFPSLDAKLSANQNRFDRDLHQGTFENQSHQSFAGFNGHSFSVWVDAPDPSFCGYQTFVGGRCCLNARFGPQYDFLTFASGEKKKIANEKLWAEAKQYRLPYYKVWADAPSRYCKKSYGGLSGFFG